MRDGSFCWPVLAGCPCHHWERKLLRHGKWIRLKSHLVRAVQVDFSTLSAVIAVKTLGKAFEAVRGKGVPIIWVRLMLPEPRPPSPDLA